MKNRVVEIVAYDATWPDVYQIEIKRLAQEWFNQVIAEAYHIGSTAIPGMPAKPVIDILLTYREWQTVPDIELQLEKFGYARLRKNIIPNVSFFTYREEDGMRYHIHLYPVGDPQVKRHILFRDYLSQHPHDAAAYQALKLALAQQYRHDIKRYVESKSELVQQIDRKAKQWKQHKFTLLSPSHGPAAKHWTNEAIILAMEANLNVHMTHFAQYMDHVKLVRIPDYTLVDAQLPDDTFNYMLRADLTADNVEATISDVTTYFRTRQRPFSWWLSPSDLPIELDQYLLRADYRNTENNKAMYFDLDAWNDESSPAEQSELQIIRALDISSLHDFAMVLTNHDAAFAYVGWLAEIISEDDPIEYYVGYVNQQPVVRGLICYYGNVAGLYWLSTIPTMRNKGYGTAMQQYRLKRAKESGYHIAVLQASEQGFPLYQRLGYKECGVYREFKIES